MKRTIVVLFFSGAVAVAVFGSHAAAAPVLDTSTLEVEKALANEDWARAELLLGRQAKSDLAPEKQFRVQARRAWVALQMGQKERARRFLERARALEGQDSPRAEALLLDVRLALRLANAPEKLPPRGERVVLSPSADAQESTEAPFQRVQEWVQGHLEDFLDASTPSTPFAKPVPPELERGEFEKTEDFIQRVEKAQKQYMARVKAVRRGQKANQERQATERALRERRLPRVRRVLTQYALHRFVGAADFEVQRYAADPELFPGKVALDGANKTYEVVVPEPIQTAPEVKDRLQEAAPFLVFRLGNDSLALSQILLDAPEDSGLRLAQLGQEEGMGSKVAEYQVPEVDLAGKGQSAPSGSSAGEALDRLHQATEVLALNLDPEIKRLRGELAQAQQADNQDRIAKLRGELQQLQKKWQSTFEDDLPKLLERTASEPTDPNKYALVIGISDYAQTHNVPFAARSARMFAMVASKVLGVPEDNIQTFYNDEATGSRLATRFRYAGEKLERGERLYVYYAGHGLPAQQQGGTPYLLPQDLAPGYGGLNDELRLSNIWEDLTASGEGRVLAFLDSCFSGQSDNRPVYKGAAPGLLRRAEMPEPPSDNLTVITAGSSEQFANYYPDKGHRLFGYFLMRGLLEGKEEPQALADYLKDRVTDVSRKLGPAYEQTPQIRGQLGQGAL